MEENKSIFSFFGSIFSNFGITICIMMAICKIFGDDAQTVSIMFSLGSEGLSISILFQFLMATVIINCVRYFLFSDQVIKKMSVSRRTAFTLASAFIVIAVFILVFHWFEKGIIFPWIMYIITYLITVVVAVLLTTWREKVENKQMEEGLERLKKQWENEEHGKHNI